MWITKIDPGRQVHRAAAKVPGDNRTAHRNAGGAPDAIAIRAALGACFAFGFEKRGLRCARPGATRRSC